MLLPYPPDKYHIVTAIGIVRNGYLYRQTITAPTASVASSMESQCHFKYQ
ncbi:hypothetical protein QWZ13_12205 [Reinekea marina]|nr:hypothetical protein [Reinekea marina]MDN3649677.1 hypothetical protein [Reinekea marina]